MGRLTEWIKKRLGIKNTSHEHHQSAALKVKNKETEEEIRDTAKESAKSCEEVGIEMPLHTGTGAVLKAMTNNERRRRGIPLRRKRGFATAEKNERRAGRRHG